MGVTPILSEAERKQEKLSPRKQIASWDTYFTAEISPPPPSGQTSLSPPCCLRYKSLSVSLDTYSGNNVPWED